MRIRRESIGHYVARMRSGERFAFAGYSDAEWNSILGERAGARTALGQVLDPAHGDLLADVLRRRWADPHFLFAVPSVLWTLPGFAEGQIDWWCGANGVGGPDRCMTAYERDAVTDDLARDAGLYPLVGQLRRMRVGMVGPTPLKCMIPALGSLRSFTEIETPNLHMAPGGIDAAVADVLAATERKFIDVVAVSAGVSAAVIIDRLYDRLPHVTLFDCGSIWDAFAGIGGQREWRAKLYADPAALREWRRRNLYGK